MPLTLHARLSAAGNHAVIIIRQQISDGQPRNGLPTSMEIIIAEARRGTQRDEMKGQIQPPMPISFCIVLQIMRDRMKDSSPRNWSTGSKVFKLHPPPPPLKRGSRAAILHVFSYVNNNKLGAVSQSGADGGVAWVP